MRLNKRRSPIHVLGKVDLQDYTHQWEKTHQNVHFQPTSLPSGGECE